MNELNTSAPDKLSKPIDKINIQQLAYDIATDLLDIDVIIEQAGITKKDLRTLLTTDEFRALVHEQKTAWAGATNAKERVRIKAAMAAEDGLADLYAIFKSATTNTTARLEAYKQLTALAEVGPKKDAPGDTGGKFSLTINLGDAKQVATITGQVLEDMDE